MTVFHTRRRAMMAGMVCAAVSAMFGGGLSMTSAHAASAGRGTIALVMQIDGPNASVDRAVQAHLEARGYRVNVLGQDARPSSIGDASLVILSSTISSKSVDPGWRQVQVPLLTWENDVLDDLAMTGKRHDTDFGEAGRERYLWLVNAPHPAAGGVPAGVVNVYQKQAGMSWGKPGLGASIIATLYGQPEKAAIFTYEKGATMDYETLAPARRVMFFLGNDTFTNLAGPGVKLFDAAVDWAIGR